MTKVNSFERILRCTEVINRRGDSRTALYNDIAAGLYPTPIQIGARRVGWREYEVDALVRARVAGKSAEQIRRMVKILQVQRASAADGICA